MLPEAFLVREFESADWVRCHPKPPVRREWFYTSTGISLVTTDDSILNGEFTDATKFFFKVGYIGFNITENRKYVMFVYLIGPRYGRGQVFHVKYQGKRGLLQSATGFQEWIS